MTDDNKTELALKRSTRFGRLVHVVSCSSTQDLALASTQEAGSDAEDAVFWTEHQRQGRGRQQREWHDEPGADLLVTFRVRQELPSPAMLPAVLPAAVAQAIEYCVHREVRIKWPNDVYLDGRKLAGMLVDSGFHGSDCYLIGVGINCNRVRFPPDLEVKATSLALATGNEIDRSNLLVQLAGRIDAALTSIVGRDHDELLELFRDRLGLLGRDVEVQTTKLHEGRLTAINFTELVLDDEHSLPLGLVRGIRPCSRA